MVTTVLAIVVNSVATIVPESWGVVVAPGAGGGGGGAGLRAGRPGGPVRRIRPRRGADRGVVLFTLVLSGFFDAMGTIIGVSDEAGLVDSQGRVPRLGAILTVDGVAVAIGGFASASANTVFVESAAGVGEGARTGLASPRHRRRCSR